MIWRKEIWMLLPLIILSGCRHKDLCYPAANTLVVNFDWTEEPEVIPKNITTFFYPIDTEGCSRDTERCSAREPIRWDFSNREGGEVRLTPGRYRVLAFNNDSEVLRYREEQRYETIESFTGATLTLNGMLSGVRYPRGDADEPHQLPPDPFYAGRVDYLRVEPAGSNTSLQQVVLIMKREYIDIDVEIAHIGNLSQAVGITASLTGLAGGYFIGLDKLAKRSVSVPIEMKWAKEGDAAYGSSTAYGIQDEMEHTLTLYVVMQDGKGYIYTFDVTKQVIDQEGKKVIRVVIDEEIKLPEAEPQSGGGWHVEVDEWTNVYLDIKM